MADVQFAHAGQRGDGLHVEVVQAMAGIEAHAGLLDQRTSGGHALQLSADGRAGHVAAFAVEGLGVGTGVQFADRGTSPCSGLDLGRLGVDEDAGDDAVVGQPADGVGDGGFLGQDVEPALGGDLVAAFGHQHRHLGLESNGDIDHLGGGGHLQVQLDLRLVAQPAHVSVLDVAAILAQMHGDAVGAPQVRLDGGPDRIGFIGTSRLADGGDVVDVDAEFDHERRLKSGKFRDAAGPSGCGGYRAEPLPAAGPASAATAAWPATARRVHHTVRRQCAAAPDR